MPKATCEKHNCSLDKGHVERDGSWHVKKGARGKIIISWLDGEWKGTDGSHGTYRYQDHPVEADTPLVEGEPKFGTRPNLPFPKPGGYLGFASFTAVQV